MPPAAIVSAPSAARNTTAVVSQVLHYPRMKVSKLSISFDPKLGDKVRAAARKARAPVSTWLAQAAIARLRADALGSFLDDWEAKHGEFTPEELARAKKELAPLPKKART